MENKSQSIDASNSFSLIVALPFDNALFHLFSFLLLFFFSRTFFPRRSGELKWDNASQMGAYVLLGYMGNYADNEFNKRTVGRSMANDVTIRSALLAALCHLCLPSEYANYCKK